MKKILRFVAVSGLISALFLGSMGAATAAPLVSVLGEEEVVSLGGDEQDDHRATSARHERRGGRHTDDEVVIKVRGEKEARVLKVPAGEVENYVALYRSRHGDIEYAEPNYIATKSWAPNDSFYGFQWNFDNPVHGGVGAEEAWTALGAPGTPGQGAIVAVVDTGVAYENATVNFKKYYRAPDLANTCFVQGHDFVNNDTHANDDESHGTHVTGTIAQSTNNALGVAGLAFKTCVMPVKVLDRNGSGTYANVAAGIRYAADNGANVINLSLGGPVPGQVIEDAVAYAYGKGVTVVAASGNDNGPVGYPAAYDQYVIAVGATRYDEARAPYSNFGTSLDIVAPGGDTAVDQNGDGYGDGILQQTFNPSTKQLNAFAYYFFQGTSMATPHVAGAAALLVAAGVATTPDTIRTALETSADDLGTLGADTTYGHGLLNIPAALAFLPGPVDAPPSVSLTAPANGAIVSGLLPVLATASDDIAVVRVDFLVDGTVIASDVSAPYETSFDSTLTSEGSHTVAAQAFDSINQSSLASATVTVDNVNDAPVANAGIDQSVTDVNGDGIEAVTLNGSASFDPNGSIVSYDWSTSTGPIGSGASLLTTLPIGIHTITLTVTDNLGATATDTVLITVVAAPAEIEVFKDSFEVSEWNGLWTEDSQNDWFRSTQRATAGSFSAEVDGFASDAGITSIPINLQGKTNATVTFSWFIEKSLDTGEYLVFDVSTDGGVTWSEYARLRGNVDAEDVWQNKSFDVSGISSLMIRFRGKMSDSNEDADVDNVLVVAK
ncbi:MAG: serine protease [Parcubacteria group bacterium Greene0416_14]|nr:MAG: serine protease [Parcubacteria group bacterium Greene0416_14]TSC99795.1 MAG: serine protease [Parcubacteria group bacterium Greene1014_15]TSD07834.1 MAG: serine protease [Parcubacteria group bacterium Greene0714_4]